VVNGIFRNRISFWIKKKGLIQRAIAKKMGKSEQTFSKWCNNVTQPDLEEAYILSRLIGVSLEDLCEVVYEETKKEPTQSE
jgi:putative transcriptional regulator